MTRLEGAVTQEVLDELLQASTIDSGFLQDLPLAIVERPRLLSQEQLHVAGDNGQRCAQLVCRGPQSHRPAVASLLQLLEGRKQLPVTGCKVVWHLGFRGGDLAFLMRDGQDCALINLLTLLGHVYDPPDRDSGTLFLPTRPVTQVADSALKTTLNPSLS